MPPASDTVSARGIEAEGRDAALRLGSREPGAAIAARAQNLKLHRSRVFGWNERRDITVVVSGAIHVRPARSSPGRASALLSIVFSLFPAGIFDSGSHLKSLHSAWIASALLVCSRSALSNIACALLTACCRRSRSFCLAASSLSRSRALRSVPVRRRELPFAPQPCRREREGGFFAFRPFDWRAAFVGLLLLRSVGVRHVR